MTNNPIGIFDSGVGGTSIWKEIHSLLPYEETVYLADSLNAPYGNKTVDEIIALSIKNTELLIEMGCKLIVVACNTATTNAISILRKNYKIPFIGIEPAIKPAAFYSKSKSIGVLATKGTLSSFLFSESTKGFTKNTQITEVVGEGLVPLIEAGKINDDETTMLLKTFLQPMIDANIDYLVLGCSHYPYLIPSLTKILPEHIKIIDSGEAVARQTKHILQENNLLSDSKNEPNFQFFTNTSTKTLDFLLKSYAEEISISEMKF